jgi:lysozyme
MKHTKKIAVAITIAAALPVVAVWEGLKLKPYYDIVGVRTVCYGETRGVQERTYTKAECDRMLAGGLEEFYAKIDPCMPDDVPPKAAGMFLSLAYNIGPGAFCKSQTIQSAFARKDYVAACNGMKLFNRAGGRVVQGLVNRRAEEAKLCLAGLK